MATDAKNEIAVQIGAAIKAARKAKGLTQKGLSELLELTVSAVGGWEAGNFVPAYENLYQVAKVLEIDARALSQGSLVYLKDVPAHEVPASYSEKADESIIRLWEILGHLLSAKNETRHNAISVLEEFIEATQPDIWRAIKTKQRS